jgi:hypothetical protein
MAETRHVECLSDESVGIDNPLLHAIISSVNNATIFILSLSLSLLQHVSAPTGHLQVS